MRPREVARVRDQREEHLRSQTAILQLTSFADNLIFYSNANQIRLVLQYGGDIKKKKKTRSSCAEMQSGVQTLKRIQTLYSTPFQQFRSTVSESCWFKGCIYIAVGCCAHAYIQTYTFGLQMSDRIEGKGMAENCVMPINHGCFLGCILYARKHKHSHSGVQVISVERCAQKSFTKPPWLILSSNNSSLTLVLNALFFH